MKKTLLLIICVLFVNVLKAGDTKYTEAMKKNIQQIDSAKSADDYLDLANAFERIGNAEKTEWLPFYYSALSRIYAGYADTSSAKKDFYLDLAQKAISIADSLQPDESEIYTLKGMIAQGRLQIDPMNRYMKYGQEMNMSLKKAQELDPGNPRPDFLIAAATLYTPEQFGGGAKAAKPLFETTIKKFNEFVPANELMPAWGKLQTEMFMKRITDGN